MALKLSQSAIKLRSSINEVLYVVATSSPTANDDRNDGYIVGTRWVNTTTNDEYVCTSNVNTLAVWKLTTATGGSGVPPVVTTTDPTVNDDTLDGYVAGQLWVNTTNNKCFVAISVITGAAVWVDLTLTGGGGSTSVDDIVIDWCVNNLLLSSTRRFVRGSLTSPDSMTGVVANPGTTFEIVNGMFASQAWAAPGATNILSGKTATRSTSGTTTVLTNGNVTAGDYDQIANSLPCWWSFDFGAGVTKNINKLTLYQYFDGNNSIRDFKLQGSNDNTNWTDVYIGVMQDVHATAVTFTFEPLVTTAFRYFRLYVSSRSVGYACTPIELLAYETTYVDINNAVLTTTTHTLPDEPVKAIVAITADIGSFTLNTSFVASVSNNAGTNYDQVTLVDRGVLLPNTGNYKTYVGITTLTDRNAQDMRVKLQLTGTGPCSVKGIAVEYLK